MQKSLADYWWLVVIRGVIGIIFGLALVAYPFKTASVVALLIGLFMMIDGLILSISSFVQIKNNDKWWVLLIRGLFGIMVGLALFSWPGITIKVLFFLISIWLIFVGILMLVTAIAIRKESEMEWFVAANGIVSLFLGFFMYSSPELTFAFLGILVGIFKLISGVLTTAFGFKLHGLKN